MSVAARRGPRCAARAPRFPSARVPKGMPAHTLLPVAYGLLVASVAAFVYYIHHMAQAIRAGSVLRSVGNETRAAIERLYPEGIADEPEVPVPALPDRDPEWVIALERTAGVITTVDDGRLLALVEPDETGRLRIVRGFNLPPRVV